MTEEAWRTTVQRATDLDKTKKLQARTQKRQGAVTYVSRGRMAMFRRSRQVDIERVDDEEEEFISREFYLWQDMTMVSL